MTMPPPQQPDDDRPTYAEPVIAVQSTDGSGPAGDSGPSPQEELDSNFYSLSYNDQVVVYEYNRSLSEALNGLAREMGQIQAGADDDGDTDDAICTAACGLRDNICGLRDRVCEIAARHDYFDQVVDQCDEADDSCMSADDDVTERCACRFDPLETATRLYPAPSTAEVNDEQTP